VDGPSPLTSWTFEPLQLVPILVVALLYARRSRTLARRGTPVASWRLWCFGLGIGLLVLALASPLDALGERQFLWAHMAQHILLGDLAPLALVAGLNGPLLQPVLQFGLALVLLVVGVAAGWRLRPEPVVQPNGEITELRGELRQMRQMVALSLMQQQSASERLKGVNWSYQLQQPDREVLTALLDTLMHDPNVNVRLAAVDALRQFGGQPVVRTGVVEALGRQDSPMVQVALIDLVVDLKEKESVDTLRKLTQNEKLNEAVRTRAQKGLQELEG